MIEWQWCDLADLRPAQLYAILAAREAVFVVEQNCVYQDLDGLDLAARHLIGWSGAEVAAYLRVLGPGARFAEPSIGRVLTTRPFRAKRLGQQLLELSVRDVEERFPGQAVRISAQSHLQRFYAAFGFVTASTEYLEDGIPHVEMLRAAR